MTPCATAARWANTIGQFVFAEDVGWQKIFRERFMVLPDDILSFLAETGTEVQAHVKIDEGFKRVVSGAL